MMHIKTVFGAFLLCLTFAGPASAATSQPPPQCANNPNDPACQPLYRLTGERIASKNEKVVSDMSTTARKVMDKTCRSHKQRYVVVSQRIAIARINFQYHGTGIFEYRCVGVGNHISETGANSGK